MAPITPNNQANPFRIANAYGAKPIAVRPVPSDARPQTAAPIDRTARTDVVEFTARPQAPKVSKGTSQLLAGTVSTPVDLIAGGPITPTPATPARATGSPLAFYRHPADTNAAATSIDLGRGLDVEG